MAKKTILRSIGEFIADLLKAIAYEFFLTLLAAIVYLIIFSFAFWLILKVSHL